MINYRYRGRDISATTALLIIGAYVLMCAWLWPYTINTWLVYLGKAPTIVWWMGAIIGLIPYIRNLVVGAAACTWIYFNWIL